MPCRALDAFGPLRSGWAREVAYGVLMPCRALDAFGPTKKLKPQEAEMKS